MTEARTHITRSAIPSAVIAGAMLLLSLAAEAQAPPPGMGTEEFGMSTRELVTAAEKVEGLIAKCMREQGFTYIPADYATVRKGMSADKSMPGLDEDEFVRRYGFGVSTLYTGVPPQLNDGYSPGREGLGPRNVEIYRKLSPSDRVAYNRELLGENSDATFAIGLETENFSRCGGCTQKAIAQVFKPDQLKASYYNPLDALINKDPRMKAALRLYASEMRKAGFDYSHPDQLETAVRDRLAILTQGGTLPVDKMTPEQKAGLKDLQAYEVRLARKNLELKNKIFDPLEARIQKEMFAREIK